MPTISRRLASAGRKTASIDTGRCNVAQGTAFGGTRLDQVVGAARFTAVADVYKALSNPEVLMESNIYSVIFDFRQNRLLIASGEVPAAAGRFREYPLFP